MIIYDDNMTMKYDNSMTKDTSLKKTGSIIIPIFHLTLNRLKGTQHLTRLT